MNIEWTVTMKFFTVEDDLVEIAEIKVWQPTKHTATQAAHDAANKRGKVINADYWLVDVE